MNLVDKATQFIARKYDGKRRTVLQIPYATHLFGVARTLKSSGYSETIVAAGLLHDILEDELASEQELLTLFGQEVVDLVIATTELPKSYSWQIRKENVIVRIKEKTQDEIAILLAEKIYNVRSIIVEENQFGESIWQNFNASKEKQEWYYRSIIDEVNLYHPDSLLLPQLQQAVDKLFVKVQK